MGTIYLRATDEVYDKFWAYVLAVKTEIGGYGFATINNGQLIWYDIFLVDQEVSSGSVDFTDKGMAQAIERAATQGFYDDPNGVWVWWHSHANMSVFWSTTDEGGVEALRDGGVPYLVSVVGNHKMEHKARIDVFDVPLLGQATHNDVELKRLIPDPKASVKDEIEKFVTEKQTTWAKTGKASSSTSTRSHGAGRQLPPGTRQSDPGDRLDEALGYAEYSRAELDGEPSFFISTSEPGFDTDDDGVIFNWQDVIEYVGDAEDAQEWKDLGWDVVKYHGEFFLLQRYDRHDDGDDEVIEADAEEIEDNETLDNMEKLESRVNGDSRPPIQEAHAR